MPVVDVTVWSYEMRDPQELRPARAARLPLDVREAEIASPELARFFYTSVGGDWYWVDRLEWTYDEWRRWLERASLSTHVGYVRGTPAGFFMLERQPTGSVEIAFFGLLPSFVGEGLGGELVTVAVRTAWAAGARRVWLHTCSLDGPHARANYEARGFRCFREDVAPVRLPDDPPGPWPGARRPLRRPSSSAA